MSLSRKREEQVAARLWPNGQRASLLLQGLLAGGLLLGLAAMLIFAAANLKRQGIASGFAFLDKTAGFDIIQHLIPYDETMSYGRAFVVALLNTLLVSALGVVAATVLGVSLGVARLSPSWVIAKAAWLYVEVVRNVPLLLHVFFWYFGVLRALPGARESLSFLDIVFLNNRGLYLPNPLTWELPELRGFNFAGGIVLLPELVALFLSLAIYTAAFIAEIVRAGIQAVPKGQSEAASALGLTRAQSLRYVVMPLAMRLIVPPLTSQYLNLTKNSSLAAAIAYPDLVLVFAGTVLMQTGQAVEVVAMTMGVYLILSLSISWLLGRYNQRLMRKMG